MRNFIKKLQNLPEKSKKIILWTIVIVLGIALLIFFIKNTEKRINKLQGEYFSPEMNVQGLQQNLNSFPSSDVSKTANQIQQILNQVQNQNEP